MTPPYADNLPPTDAAPVDADTQKAISDAAPVDADTQKAASGQGARRLTRALMVALAASIAVHVALSFWPVDIESSPDDTPLQATITEIPPPPDPDKAAAAQDEQPAAKAAPPQPKTTVVTTQPEPPADAPQDSAGPPEPPAVADSAPAPAPESAVANAPDELMGPPEPPAVADAAPAPDMGPPPPVLAAPTTGTAPTVARSAFDPDAVAEDPQVELPPRLDLAYKVFLGTQGFLIGDATYRFEHAGNQYRILTVGQARGLAALLVRGQGKLESRGVITRSGLQPQEFAIERGSADRREVARFDWETGIVTLHEQKTEPLELPTFDPMALMWQFYFSPPITDELSFAVATTRRVFRYTIRREGTETIKWANGEIETERWHRRSDDGKTDSYAWLAPSMHYVPVKVRVVATNRGTLEALLDSIRIDEPPKK